MFDKIRALRKTRGHRATCHHTMIPLGADVTAGCCMSTRTLGIFPSSRPGTAHEAILSPHNVVGAATVRSSASLSRHTRPRLLLVTHFYPSHRGGVEIVAGELAVKLANDFRIRWVAGRDSEPYAPPHNVELVPLRVWNGIERRTGIPVPLPSPGAMVRLLREVRHSDVIWVHDLLYPANLLAAVAARLLRRPLVVTVHVGPIPYRNPLLRRIMGTSYRSTARLFLPTAAKVAFVSERVRDETCRPGSWPRPPAFIPNGFDPRVFRPPTQAERVHVRQEFDAETRPLLLFVGRFVERKGLALIRSIAAETPGWRWVLAGRGPIDPSAWAAPNVTVVRGVSGRTLSRLYGAADVLVLPSLGEGFPLVVIEAMACGTPAIVDPSTAAGDRSAATCLEIEPVSSSDALRGWHDHLERMLARPDGAARRRELSEFAVGHWSWDRAAEAYRGVLRDAFPG
jgi:phosphatidyl-myo-inositol dimannoside synthase